MRCGKSGSVRGIWLVAALFALSVAFIGCGGGGDSTSPVTVPSAPANLTANAGDNSATLSWSPVSGATSYNIYRGASPGVTKANGTKVSGVQSPNTVSGLTNGTPYYFVVTAVNSAGESAVSAEVFATPVAPVAAFSQADATGTWDGIKFGMGSEAGWQRMGANIDGSGSITPTYVLDSNGNTTLPAPGSMIWTISATGVVTEGGVNGDPNFRGQMSSNKQLVIVKRGGTGGTSAGLMVFRKRTDTVFSNADLANISFVSHELFSGTDNTWEWAVGTTDSSRNLTLSSRTDPSGTSGPFPNIGVISVNSDGIVTVSSDPSLYGFMTNDKKVFFTVNTADVGKYNFLVGQLTGQTYTQSDLAGTYNFSSIRNTLTNPWSYGTFSIDATGTLTYLTYTDSAGGATPGSSSRVLSASGVITSPTDTTFHAQLSYNKDLFVRTNTSAGRYGLAIGFK